MIKSVALSYFGTGILIIAAGLLFLDRRETIEWLSDSQRRHGRQLRPLSFMFWSILFWPLGVVVALVNVFGKRKS
jgi:hypothetical protein